MCFYAAQDLQTRHDPLPHFIKGIPLQHISGVTHLAGLKTTEKLISRKPILSFKLGKRFGDSLKIGFIARDLARDDLAQRVV